jgi:hypothetical protein
MGNSVEFTRRELFDLVWSKPLRQVAAKVGVSDVAIGKGCKRANVPRPPQGYWVLPEGKRPQRPALPEGSEHWRGDKVRFDLPDTEKAAQFGAPGKDFPARIGAMVVVPDHLESPHKLVALARDHQATERTYRHSPCSLKGADIRVSKLMLPRALRVMDAFVKASESLGDKWKRGEQGMTVTCDGIEMPVRMTESGKALVIPKPEKKPRPGRWQPDYEPPEYEWIGSGELKLFVDAPSQFPARREWKDSPSAPLESKLTDALNGLPKIAAALKAAAREREDWNRRFKEEEERKKAEERCRQAAHAKRLNLRAVALASSRAELIRAMCTRARQGLSDLPPELEAWLEWAEREAELLDPLTSVASLAVKVGEAPLPSVDDWWATPPKRNPWD